MIVKGNLLNISAFLAFNSFDAIQGVHGVKGILLVSRTNTWLGLIMVVID